MWNEILKVPRCSEDVQKTRRYLAETFPFLQPHPDILDNLAHWSEFYIGIVDENVDPDTPPTQTLP